MSNNFPYKTFGGWVKSFGLKISDLTEDELSGAKEEYEIRKSGSSVLDGLESYAYIIKGRKAEQEIQKAIESQG